MRRLGRFFSWLLSISMLFRQPREFIETDDTGKTPHEPPHLHLEAWGPEEIKLHESKTGSSAHFRQALITHGVGVTILQCRNHNTGAFHKGDPPAQPDFWLSIREGFPSAFTPRSLALGKRGTLIRLQFNNVALGVRLL